jgi:hypothetical protein
MCRNQILYATRGKLTGLTSALSEGTILNDVAQRGGRALNFDWSRSWLRIASRAVLIASGAAALAAASPANATNCITGVPSFQVDLQVTNTSPADICRTTPIPSMSISKGPTFASARASVGRLGTSALAVGSDGATAHARFKDDFPFFMAGTGMATMVFTVSLTGSISGNGADVAGFLGFVDLVDLNAASTTFKSDGSEVLRLAIPLGVSDTIDVTGDLSVDAIPRALGGFAAADFIDTLGVDRIQLFDASGRLLDGSVVLTDAQGSALPAVLPPPTPAPEPASLALLMVGIATLTMRGSFGGKQ